MATLAMLTHLAYANVIVSTTRAIVPMPPGNTTVRVTNASQSAALVQIWADTGDAQSSPDTSDAPFEISPALFVLAAQGTQVVRIDYEGDARDDTDTRREKLFWLNVLDVPSRNDANNIPEKSTEHDMGAEHDTAVEHNTGAEHDTAVEHDNVLRFVVRSRIKLIVRPGGLTGSALHAPEQMTWHIAPAAEPGKEMRTGMGNRPVMLVGTNPSPFHITCAPLFVLADDGHDQEIGTHVFAPGESREVTIKSPEKPASSASSHDRQALPWSTTVCHAINDYGSIDMFKAPITRD